MATWLLVAGYSAAIVVANLLVAWYGPAVTAINAFVLAGYEDEHAAHMPDGWRMVAWKANGGMSNRNKSRENVNRHKERLWFSPHCLGNESAVSNGLFDGGGA